MPCTIDAPWFRQNPEIQNRRRLPLTEGSLILPIPHPSVVFREVSDGAVLLQLQDEIYFGLNEVGAHVWQLLPPVCSQFDDLCSRLEARYPGVASEQIRVDVSELLDQLRGHKLVVDPS